MYVYIEIGPILAHAIEVAMFGFGFGFIIWAFSCFIKD